MEYEGGQRTVLLVSHDASAGDITINQMRDMAYYHRVDGGHSSTVGIWGGDGVSNYSRLARDR